MMPESKPVTRLPILIVDDDITFLSFISAALTRHERPYQVAVTGDQALALLKDTNVQAVLLDRRLPDRDGVEVLREIVKDPDHPPVILISGAASIASAWEAGCLGAARYLEKPLRIPELLALLDQLPDSPQSIANTNHEPTSSISSTAATGRLAQVVLRASSQPVDFKHGRGLAKTANTGYGTMRHWCRIARVPGRAFVKFTRGFWATRRAQDTGRVPFELLDCLERETGAKILDPGLPAGTTIEGYCARQTHLPTSHPLVAACLNLFAAPGLSTGVVVRPSRLVPREQEPTPSLKDPLHGRSSRPVW